MAKKHLDTVDLGAELKKRVKVIEDELPGLDHEIQTACINERAHLKQYYIGLSNRAEAELAYLKGLLEG